MHFFSYPLQRELPKLDSYVLLDIDGEPLTEDDKEKGILLIDATWRLAEKIKKIIPENVVKRRLSAHFRTAYPRRQDDCPDPQAGLASVEALYIAHNTLSRPCEELLQYYYSRG